MPHQELVKAVGSFGVGTPCEVLAPAPEGRLFILPNGAGEMITCAPDEVRHAPDVSAGRHKRCDALRPRLRGAVSATSVERVADRAIRLGLARGMRLWADNLPDQRRRSAVSSIETLLGDRRRQLGGTSYSSYCENWVVDLLEQAVTEWERGQLHSVLADPDPVAATLLPAEPALTRRKPPRASIVDAYLSSDRTMRDVARDFGVSVSTVSRHVAERRASLSQAAPQPSLGMRVLEAYIARDDSLILDLAHEVDHQTFTNSLQMRGASGPLV